MKLLAMRLIFSPSIKFLQREHIPPLMGFPPTRKTSLD